MLADTDVGSIITAGQSGVQWGYRLLLLQFVLVPILYMVQELTVRLGVFTGRGHGELISDTFGRVWAWVSAAGLGIATVGALLTEFSGVAGVGELYGVPRADHACPSPRSRCWPWSLTGSYRRVERAAIAVGLFELAFFCVAWAAHPDLGAHCCRVAGHPIRQQGLSVSGGGEYRRRDHAVDDLLPAVRDRRQKAAAGAFHAPRAGIPRSARSSRSWSWRRC